GRRSRASLLRAQYPQAGDEDQREDRPERDPPYGGRAYTRVTEGLAFGMGPILMPATGPPSGPVPARSGWSPPPGAALRPPAWPAPGPTPSPRGETGASSGAGL